MHYSHAKSVGSSDLYAGLKIAPVSEQSTVVRRGKTYDESTVQSLIKAAVSSALQYSEQQGSSVSRDNPEREALVGEVKDGSGDKLNTSKTADANAAVSSHNLIAGRMSILEDRVDGIETLQLGQLNSMVTHEALTDLLSTVAQLEGRLRMAEEYIIQVEATKAEIEEQSRNDQIALKDYIVRLEENQRNLLSRMSQLETTLESDSETSIGLLDMLLKKISSSAIGNNN